MYHIFAKFVGEGGLFYRMLSELRGSQTEFHLREISDSEVDVSVMKKVTESGFL